MRGVWEKGARFVGGENAQLCVYPCMNVGPAAGKGEKTEDMTEQAT